MNIHSITNICLVIIGAVFIVSLIYTLYARKNQKLLKNRRIIDSLPNIVSALGVIGTFLGITLGLVDFNPSPGKIDASISTLLGGLKTAFYTSLAGMLGSLLLRFFVTDKVFDKEEEGISSAEQASLNICKEIQKMSQQMIDAIQSSSNLQSQMTQEIKNIKSSQVTFFNSVQSQLEKMNSASIDAMNTNFETLVLLNRNHDENITTIHNNIKTISEHIARSTEVVHAIHKNQVEATNKINENLTQLNKDQNEKLDGINNNMNGIEERIVEVLNAEKNTASAMQEQVETTNKINESLTQLNKDQNEKLDEINNDLNEIGEYAATILSVENDTSSALQEQIKATKKVNETIQSEIDTIRNKMTETNGLLVSKFDEFSELLQKSNTEALVEVMKKVTEEFQKQMNDLISKLVQENFEQLNNSVEKLNIWQHENKEIN